MLSWDDLTFGFEFEFIGNATPEARDQFKAFMKENNIPYVFTGVYGKNSEDAWTLGADGSVGDMTTCKYIEKAKRNFGYELVRDTPILHHKTGKRFDERTLANDAFLRMNCIGAGYLTYGSIHPAGASISLTLNTPRQCHILMSSTTIQTSMPLWLISHLRNDCWCLPLISCVRKH